MIILQINRQLEIIYLLLNKDRTTAKELAERFNVSTRTIYRDLDSLSLAGIPIYTETGKYGGISLMPDFVLNKSILSENEQREILASLQGLTQIQSAEAWNVLEKLTTVFNKTPDKWLEVDFSDWSFDTEDKWGGLKKAILQKQVTEFNYYSSYSEKTSRKVEPIQLWFKSRAWYLKAYDLNKEDVRIFRLSRLRNLVITDEIFTERNLPNEDTDFIPPESKYKTEKIKLRIKPEMSHRVLDEYADVVENVELDGSFIISVCWPEDNWLYTTILSFGEYIEVLEPNHLKTIIKEKAKRIYEIY